MGETLMEVREVREEFIRSQKQSARRFDAVANVSLTLGAGDMVACMGRSGSGKTTVPNMMARLLEPTQGSVFLEGQNLYDLDDDATFGRRPRARFQTIRDFGRRTHQRPGRCQHR